MPFSRGSSQPRNRTRDVSCIFCIAGELLLSHLGSPYDISINFTTLFKTKSLHISINEITATAKSLQSCPTLCDPTDGSPPGSPVPWILQARTLEWVAISFSNA